ncbi:MAG: DUF3987 domain-containing protein [Phycisphaerales bacterium]|nr:DUF3987 domain-containing protein [Phycisphaerales bacterium]
MSAPTPVDRVLSALREHGHEPRKAGAGWCCKCPAHDDRTPSLSIHAGDDGRALVNCHAGCTVHAVCGSIGLRASDLFEPDPNRRTGDAPRTRRRGDGDETTRIPPRGADSVTVASDTTGGRTFATARDAVAELERRRGGGPRSATWTYTNAAGDPVGLVVRWNTLTGKDVRPVSRKADGSGWIIGGMPTPRPLYALPDLLATPAGSRVFIVEGEKAADAARAVGLVATTSPHGSKSASKADWSPLAGREVVILPDHDDAGERYTDDVARLATDAGAKSVRVVRLVELWAGMPEGGDMADLVEHRGGDVDPIRAEVEALANKTEPEAVTPDAPAVPAFTPFPVDVLPEPIRSFVADAAKSIGCDPSYVALPLLSGLASAIGNTHRIALKRGWTEPAIVWTAIVGESGTHKTPAFKAALKAIRKAQAQAFKEHEAALAEWEAQHLRYEAELTAWKRDAAKAKPGDGYTVAPPQKPAPPIARRYIVSDTTTEALAPILLGNPRGVLLARDELAGWIGSFDRYAKAGRGGADSAHWLSMHNGEALTIDRKTAIPPTIHVPSASVSIAGGIQPGILARALGQEHHESGLLARLLFAMPPRRVKRWTEADVDANTEAAVASVFDRLFSLTMEPDPESPLMADGHGPDMRPRLVRLADDGKRAWVTFYNEHAGEQVNLSGDEAAAWSKLEGYAARLALVVHLTRWAAGDATLRDPARVDEASIAAGVVLARWFGDEARRVYAILGESDEGRESRRLVEWIERKGGTVTVRDLTRGPREYRNDPERAAKALGELVAAGVGRWEVDAHGPKGGRPADRFRLLSRGGDTGDGDETPVNVGNRAGSVTVATVAKPTDDGDGWGEL